MAEFTLYTANKNYSSWSLRAWLPLVEAGFAFDEVMIPLRQPETRQTILGFSGAGKVPVLRHRDLFIWDSLAIGEYLAELSPRLLPEGREARAIARAVIAEMHSGFQALRGNLPMNTRATRAGFGIPAEVAPDIQRIAALWTELRGRYGAGGEMLFGPFSLADAAFAPVVSRFRTYGVALEGEAAAYAEALWARPSMQAWLAASIVEPMAIAAYDEA